MPLPAQQAKLSALYKDANNSLHKIDTVIATDPEGVTEEDAQRLQHRVYLHLSSEDKSFVEPVLVLVQGGKA
jgi:hypothetical protein